MTDKIPALQLRVARVVPLAVVAALGASFHQGVAAHEWKVIPSVSARGTYSDNIDLQRAGEEQDDFVLELIPGIRIFGESPRLKANVNYSLSTRYYHNSTNTDTITHRLLGSGTLEAVEGWLFMDATASVSKENLSTFGRRPVDDVTGSANRTDVRAFSVSPYIRREVSSLLKYELRYTYLSSDSDSQSLNQSTSDTWKANFQGDTRFSRVGWFADYNRRTSIRENQPDMENESYRIGANYAVSGQLKLSAFGGHDKNDFAANEDQRSAGVYGVGASWNPAERTAFVGEIAHRYFGTGYNLRLDHRTPRTAWSLTGSRDQSTLGDELIQRSAGEVLDLLFSQLQSQFPNPIQRLAEALRIVSQLGSPTSLTDPISFVSNRVFVNERIQGTAALIGARNTVTFSLARFKRKALETNTSFLDDFSDSQDITDRTAAINWSYKLSALSTINALVSDLRSKGEGTNVTDTTRRHYSLGLTTSLGPKTTGTLTARYVKQDSTTDPYDENALVAFITHTF